MGGIEVLLATADLAVADPADDAGGCLKLGAVRKCASHDVLDDVAVVPGVDLPLVEAEVGYHLPYGLEAGMSARGRHPLAVGVVPRHRVGRTKVGIEVAGVQFLQPKPRQLSAYVSRHGI